MNPSAHSDRAPATRFRLGILLRYVLAAAILVGVFSAVPVSDVIAVVREARPGYFAAALFVSLLTQWLIAIRLRLVTTGMGMDFTTIDLFRINAATRFYGLFLPGGNLTGIAVRFYKLSGSSGQHAATAVTLFSERVVATLTLCAVGLMFWLIERPSNGEWLAWIMLAILLVAALVLLLLLGYISLPFTADFRGNGRVGRAMRQLGDAIQLTRSLPRSLLVLVLVLSVFVHLVSVAAFVLIADSLGMVVPFATMGWIRSGLILATMIPVSVSGIGLREVAALLLLTDFPDEAAVAFSLLVFVATVLVFSLYGGVVEARRFMTR